MQLNNVFKVLQCVVALLPLLMQCAATMDSQSHNATVMPLQQSIEQRLEEEERSYGSVRLKRKRRYLEFPEGSSFQLVYDLIVGVVDYTNYLILGVTVALAWELPSKPPSEILSDLTDRLKDGTLGTTRNDTISNIKYVDTKVRSGTTAPIKYYNNIQPLFRPPMHAQYYANKHSDSYYRTKDYKNWQKVNGRKDSWRRKDSNYFSRKPPHPFKQWSANKGNPKNSSGSFAKYPWWNLGTRLNDSVAKRPLVRGSRRFDQSIKHLRNQKYSKSTGRSEHRIFPIFGKRSIPDSDSGEVITHHHHRRSVRSSDSFSKWDRIHVRHHRSTRHDLYERIETYLDGRGSNGHHCVLRALCETGQKSEEHEPGSFVAELMRALFTLPEAFTGEHGYKQQRYDAASVRAGDCATRYHLCKDSVWSSHFVM